MPPNIAAADIINWVSRVNNSIPAISFLPDTAVLEVTGKCNHSCLFCSCPWFAPAESIPRDLSTDEWKDIILEFSQNGVFRFSFSGGECTLRSDFQELLRFASQLRVKAVCCKDDGVALEERSTDIVVLSNGRGMSLELLHFLKDINVHLSMSLPGLTAFPELTGTGLPATSVLQWFQKAADIGMQTTAAITVTQKNFHELYETIATALISGASAILLNRYLPGGRGLLHDELTLTLEQVKQIPWIAEEVLAKARHYGHVGTEYPRCLADPCDFKYLNVGTRCAAATGFFVVGPDGYIRVCNYSPKKLCHWSQWRTLMDNSYWRNYVFRKNRPMECRGCSQYANCDGGCRECAALLSKDPCGRDPVFPAPPPKVAFSN